MECLDDLSLGVLGQTLGKDKDRSLVASPTTADHTALSMDAPQISFNVLHQTLVYLSQAVRWEEDHSSSESVSRELLLGVPLHAPPLTSTLR